MEPNQNPTQTRALLAALEIQGNGIYQPSNLIPKENPYFGCLHQGKNFSTVVVDVNAIRTQAGHNPVVVAGQFYLPLHRNSITEQVLDVKGDIVMENGLPKTIQRKPTFEDREKMLTAPTVMTVVEEDGILKPNQEIYLVISRVCGTDAIERPVYHLVISTGEDTEPVVLPFDLWVYKDGTVAVEAALNGFNWTINGNVRQSNRVRLDGNTAGKNNFRQVNGWIFQALNLAGVKVEASTSAEFDNRKAHSENRDNARRQGSNRVVAAAAPAMVATAASGASADVSDPFADMQVGLRR